MGLPYYGGYVIGVYIWLWGEHGASLAILLAVGIFALLTPLWLPGVLGYVLERRPRCCDASTEIPIPSSFNSGNSNINTRVVGCWEVNET